jgi:hypothetical protein
LHPKNVAPSDGWAKKSLPRTVIGGIKVFRELAAEGIEPTLDTRYG